MRRYKVGMEATPTNHEDSDAVAAARQRQQLRATANAFSRSGDSRSVSQGGCIAIAAADLPPQGQPEQPGGAGACPRAEAARYSKEKTVAAFTVDLTDDRALDAIAELLHLLSQPSLGPQCTGQVPAASACISRRARGAAL